MTLVLQAPPAVAAKPQARRGRRLWMPLGVGLTALIITCWGIRGPSLWRDEAATAAAASRSWAGLFRLLQHVDAVHGLYYVLVHLVAGGGGEVALRLPSAIAVAITAAEVAILGRMLGSEKSGLVSGLVYAGLPVAGLYGQTARSYALVSAVAVLATILFVRAMRSESWWAYSWYGLSLVLLGNLHLFALLIVGAHGVAFLRHRPYRRWRWPVAVLVAGYGVVPLAVFASGQQGQIGWIVRPGLHTISRLVEALIGPPVLVAVVAVVIGFALRRGTPMAGLAVAWLVLPSAILLVVSQVTPVFAIQYVVFCVPAVALLVGEGLAAMRILPRLLVASLLLALVVPVQLHQRRENSREDLRAAASVVQSNARPGDAVLFSIALRRTVASAYPKAFAALDDVALVESPDAAGSYGGVEVSGSRLVARLTRVRRVWLYAQSGAGHAAGAAQKDLKAKEHALEKAGFRLAGQWHPRSVELFLFTLRYALRGSR